MEVLGDIKKKEKLCPLRPPVDKVDSFMTYATWAMDFVSYGSIVLKTPTLTSFLISVTT